MISNLYHIGPTKGAYTWFRLFFGIDPKIGVGVNVVGSKCFNRYTKLLFNNFREVSKFPENAIMSGIDCSYAHWNTIVKSNNYKGVNICRDPRQLLVSAYWSWRNSHINGHPNRQVLKNLSYEDGLCFVMTYMHTIENKFTNMIDWFCNCNDNRIFKVKFEEVFKNAETQTMFLRELFDFFEIDITYEEFIIVDKFLSFKNLSNGRNRGSVNNNNHFRVGTSSWETDIPKSVLSKFYNSFDYVIDKLEYLR